LFILNKIKLASIVKCKWVSKTLALGALGSTCDGNDVVGESGSKRDKRRSGRVVQGNREDLALGSCESEGEGGGCVEEACDSLVGHGDKLKGKK